MSIETPKFKKGDRVVCITGPTYEAGDGIYQGGKYTVTSVSDNGEFLSVNHNPPVWLCRRFKPENEGIWVVFGINEEKKCISCVPHPCVFEQREDAMIRARHMAGERTNYQFAVARVDTIFNAQVRIAESRR